MGRQHMRVVYKQPTGYELALVVAGKHMGLTTLNIPTYHSNKAPSNHVDTRFAGAAVLLWPRSATIVKRLQMPPVTGDRLLSAIRFELDGQLPFNTNEAVIAAYLPDAPSNAGSGNVTSQPDMSEPRPVVAFCVRRNDIDAAVAELAAQGVRVTHVVPATLALQQSLPLTPESHVHLELRGSDNEALFLVNNRLVASVWMGEEDVPTLAAQIRLWWQGLQRSGLATQASVTIRCDDEAQRALADTLAPFFTSVTVLAQNPASASVNNAMLMAGSQITTWDNLAVVELTPLMVKKQRDNARKKQQVLIAAAVAGLCVGFLAGVGRVAVANQEQRGRQLTAEWQQLASDVRSEEALRKQRDALQKEAEAWAGVLEQRIDWPLVLHNLAGAMPPGVRLTEARLEKGRSYQILGIAETPAVAAQFVDQLRQSGAWGEARLDLTKTLADAENEQVSFVIGGTLTTK